ncbi:MAG: type I-E CRISPR-associated protein Cse1/CasA [Kineosporiaceae bacterium]|nr:type I-E CRISPR-associated protein Cse1/CasA [Kineosporiaceae bacterium]
MPTEHSTFNLVDEPWIPVLGLDGQVSEQSLLTVVRDADQAAAIVGELPTQSFAILRLLLAILHRSLRRPDGGPGPGDIATWRALRSDGDRLATAVTSYLGVFHDRFDLFHPQRPFFQVADLATGKGEVSGLDKLIADVPNGLPFFTTRLGPGIESITAAEAARWLVHAHAFDPSGIRSGDPRDPRVKSGKGYPIGTGWAGQIGGVFLEGTTLRETLLLNLGAWADAGSLIDSGPDDLPPWERAQLGPTEEAPGRLPRGPIDLYTWQSRRVRLVGDRDRVSGVLLCQGDRMAPQNTWRWEPMTAWRYSKPQTAKLGRPTYMPAQHDPARSFWRGLEALLSQALPETDGGRGVEPAPRLAPALIRWTRVLRYEDALPADALIPVRAVGLAYGTQNAIVEELTDDVVRLPATLLDGDRPDLVTAALDAVQAAADVAKAAADFRQNLARAAGMGGDESEHPREAGRAELYHALDHAFREWLTTVGRDDALAATTRWQETVRAIALEVAGSWLAAAGPAALVGRSVNKRRLDAGLAHRWFLGKLHQALPYAHQTIAPVEISPEEEESA